MEREREKGTLWRVPLYLSPGLPNPTKSHGRGAMVHKHRRLNQLSISSAAKFKIREFHFHLSDAVVNGENQRNDEVEYALVN